MDDKLFILKFTRDNLIREIKTEAQARMRIWKTSSKSKMIFMKPEQQQRFDKLVHVGILLANMTDSEFYKIMKRANNKKNLPKPKTLEL